jgi:hypothetical protein
MLYPLSAEKKARQGLLFLKKEAKNFSSLRWMPRQTPGSIGKSFLVPFFKKEHPNPV